MSFENKVVIITGGASGIGYATVEAFCQEGAKVVIADLQDNGQAVSDDFNRKGYQTVFFKIDVRNEEENRALVQYAIDKFGGLDIVFANAGIAADAPVAQLAIDAWKRTIDINLTAVYVLNKFAIEHWLKENKKGIIVNCGSIHSWVGKHGVTAYAASKGGVKLLTQTLAIDYASQGIRVNAVCPGYIDTPLLKHLGDEVKQQLIKDHPIGRLGRAEEVASVVLFLASDGASFVNGTSVLVDGGYVAQ
ncbi:SDR family NAD(P)-dependent oxidoreductase [Wohlfahrtiimonas populi]|uniref:SDR family NAD(P)-dependent oxidoreductase n=1 Tax=Wohlfahrtiimonas populi TaxID=1940240 RepID=UPI00098D0291|nr:SDR family NAD(P)-dependent oxidoreductase [Wohlfahrtiimonas populi]